MRVSPDLFNFAPVLIQRTHSAAAWAVAYSAWSVGTRRSRRIACGDVCRWKPLFIFIWTAFRTDYIFSFLRPDMQYFIHRLARL